MVIRSQGYGFVTFTDSSVVGRLLERREPLVMFDRRLTLRQARRRHYSHREEARVGRGGEGEDRERGTQQAECPAPAVYPTTPYPAQWAPEGWYAAPYLPYSAPCPDLAQDYQLPYTYPASLPSYYYPDPYQCVMAPDGSLVYQVLAYPGPGGVYAAPLPYCDPYTVTYPDTYALMPAQEQDPGLGQHLQEEQQEEVHESTPASSPRKKFIEVKPRFEPRPVGNWPRQPGPRPSQQWQRGPRCPQPRARSWGHQGGRWEEEGRGGKYGMDTLGNWVAGGQGGNNRNFSKKKKGGRKEVVVGSGTGEVVKEVKVDEKAEVIEKPELQQPDLLLQGPMERLQLV